MSGGFYAGARVLVTGGTGFVGRHLVEQLTEAQAHVVVPVHERQLPSLRGRAPEVVFADLTRPEDCAAAMRGVDHVFHAAGAAAGAGATPADVTSAIATNLVLTSRVLEAAAHCGVQRCLVFSSSTVYPELDHPAREDEMWSGPPHPAYFGYGWMRRYFELLGEFVSRQSSLGVAIVRPTAIYGRHDNFDAGSSRFVPALIRRAVARERPYEVWGTGEETRDLLHVSDLARGCLLALEKHAVADPINIACGRSVRVRDVVEAVLTAADYADAEVRFNPARPGTIASRMVDGSKAREVLGFAPAISLEDGIRDTVRWYRAGL